MKRLQAVVPDEFHKQVKVKAAEEDMTIRELIVHLLQKWLEEDE